LPVIARLTKEAEAILLYLISNRNYSFKGIKMQKRNGFTTLELMVTIGIIAILTAIAVPSYIKWLPGYRLRSAAFDVYSAMQLARLRAVKENGRVGISFTNGNGKSGKFRVFFDRNNSGIYESNNDNIIKYGEMPGSVRISAPMGQSMFNGRGLVTAGAGIVRLTNSMGGAKDIQLIVTGNVRML